MEELKKIIKRPVITEKYTELRERYNQYAFEVDRRANKIQIRQAIEALYPGVRVLEVRTIVVRGKRKRQFTRRGLLEGRRPSWKKAIVTLRPGDKIELFEAI
ncbi:MAG: 50S ribosomal protein L23 [Bacteroidetes bacterium]|nr:50S ribosomal protein L23 [Rhodothermia bacterium]MCS7154546.1 50S ribosomal protein L23 [Bacteroidota bacterium]MCX7906263.1 50S ribosomal protein L23 [Bacteroidota bacterium]MDW8137339.1 50S ribosomal protein L23 [Bacteroidota bacterium]MDW8285707.1 50S ribosomal protein L23 [Bacteroidota bacterium]